MCSIKDCERLHVSRGYCKKHYRAFMKYGDPLATGVIGSLPQDSTARFWSKVNKRGQQVKGVRGRCWEWTAGISPATGYGNFWLDGRTVSAHRFAYEFVVGPIGKALTLDHLCRVRHCVNPNHLDPVTHKTNVLRGTSVSAINAKKTHCPKGHEYFPENTYVDKRGRRSCIACRDGSIALYQQRLRSRMAKS